MVKPSNSPRFDVSADNDGGQIERGRITRRWVAQYDFVNRVANRQVAFLGTIPALEVAISFDVARRRQAGPFRPPDTEDGTAVQQDGSGVQRHHLSSHGSVHVTVQLDGL